MAGDWIKMRTDLAEDPSVISMAVRLNVNEFCVVGRLHAFWSWLDRQSRDGHATGVTHSWLDRYVQCPGFAEAMVAAGWLTIGNDGMSIPNFERHNGETAKTRALTTNRKRRSRGEDVTLVSRTQRDICVTREEKRREEKKTETPRALERAAEAPGGEGSTEVATPVPEDLRLAAESYNAAAARLRLRAIKPPRVAALVGKYREACRRIRQNVPEFTLAECATRLIEQRERGSPFFRDAKFVDFEWLLKREHGGSQMNAEKVWNGNYRDDRIPMQRAELPAAAVPGRFSTRKPGTN